LSRNRVHNPTATAMRPNVLFRCLLHKDEIPEWNYLKFRVKSWKKEKL